MEEPMGYTEVPAEVKAGALAARQVYLAMIEAGFTKGEAFTLVKEMIRNAVQGTT